MLLRRRKLSVVDATPEAPHVRVKRINTIPVICRLHVVYGSLAQLARALWREGIEPLNALDAGSSPAGTTKNPDGGSGTSHALTHTFHLSLLSAAGGKSLHDRDIQRNNIPRWMNRSQRELHTSRAKLVCPFQR